jgi:hypothetical protein
MHEHPTHPSAGLHESSFANTLLRLLGICGLAVTGLEYSWSLHERPNNELLYVAIATVLALLVIGLLCKQALPVLRRTPDLLVPLGCHALAQAALSLLPMQYISGFYMEPTAALDVAVAALALIALSTATTALLLVWQTLAIVQATTSDGVNLFGELRHATTLLPRGIAILIIANVVLHGPLVAYLSYGHQVGTPLFGLVPMLVFYAVACITWGVLTCLWLPIALDRSAPLGESLAMAVRASLSNWQSNARLIVAWGLATGMVTAHYTWSNGSGNHATNMSWNVQGLWFGEYPMQPLWYTEFAEQCEVPPVGWFAMPLMVLCACMSIAVKITLLRRLDESLATQPNPTTPPAL